MAAPGICFSVVSTSCCICKGGCDFGVIIEIRGMEYSRRRRPSQLSISVHITVTHVCFHGAPLLRLSFLKLTVPRNDRSFVCVLNQQVNAVDATV